MMHPETNAGLLSRGLTDEELARTICPDDPVELGVVRAVAALMDAGIYTFESCEGGEAHPFPRPTVRFHGGSGTGWVALGACLDLGLPVYDLCRTWDFEYRGEREPCGPTWRISFWPYRDPGANGETR